MVPSGPRMSIGRHIKNVRPLKDRMPKFQERCTRLLLIKRKSISHFQLILVPDLAVFLLDKNTKFLFQLKCGDEIQYPQSTEDFHVTHTLAALASGLYLYFQKEKILKYSKHSTSLY